LPVYNPYSEPSDLTFSSGEESLKVLYRNRAIVLSEKKQAKKYLIVGDLHIGFEEKFRGTGISIEPRIDKMTNELSDLIEKQKITDLLINGDVKSGTDRITRSEWENVPKFFERMSNLCRVSVVPGNHDGGISHLMPPNVSVFDSNGVLISNILILHGHTRPLAKFQDCKQIIMGHVHPIFQKRGSPLSGQPVWVLLRVKRSQIFMGAVPSDSGEKNDLEIILMPSFNLELVVSGFEIDAARAERRNVPLLRELKEVTEAMITTVDGDLIGDSSLLPNII
jgi:putative SbcD/Mre11-related phosphoesterase